MKRGAPIEFAFALIFALLALVAYVVLFFAFSSARNETTRILAEVAHIEQEDVAVTNAEETLAALAEDETSLEAYFVSPDGIVSFLEELERSGKDLGSTVEVISVSPIASDERITIALRIIGSFTAVMRTLGSIEYGPYDARTIGTVLDTRPSDNTSEWTAAVTFSVATLPETP